MSWPALAKPALKEPTKKSLADAIVDRFSHLLTDSDSWNTGGIAAGTGLASAANVGLLSAADWTAFNANKNANCKIGGYSYVGNGAAADHIITPSPGLAVIKLVILADVISNFYAVALQGSSKYIHLAPGGNPTMYARAANVLYVSNINFAVGTAGAFNYNINGRTYYYVAIGI